MSGKTAREERREERLQKEGEAAVQERRRRLLQLGSAAVFLAVIAVAVLIVVSGSESGGGSEGGAEVEKELKGIPQSGLVLGQPTAKVTLFEFGDLQCPVCKAYSEEIIPTVIDSKVRSGEAKIEFRNFTIISAQSTPAGAAAIAAGMQGRGWNYLELFYRNQGTEGSGYVTDSFMTDLAKAARVPDIAKWNSDRKSQSVLSQVSRTTSEAQRLGFTGTPSFAVKGPHSGGLETLGTPGSASALETGIDQAG